MSAATTRPVAWVTGAGSGIGRAGALALAAAGHVVALTGRRADALEAVARSVSAAGGEAVVVPADVTDAASVAAALQEVQRRAGAVDVLVNSAGVNIARRSWADVDVDGWRQLVAVNLDGTFLCMHAVRPSMRARGTGLVVNIGSWAGRHASPMVGPGYNTTKHAVVALTHTFNMEEGRHGLRACVVMPGETDTPILDHRPVPVPPEERARMLQEDDVGRVIAFVAAMPARVCINELIVSPTHNRALAGT